MPHDRALFPRTKVFVADAIDRRVSARLAARRRAVGIDRALLDLLLDARAGTVERLETGRSRIGPRRLFQLARLLDVPMGWFFDEARSETALADPVARCGERRAEARRFLALYARIADPKGGRKFVRWSGRSPSRVRSRSRPNRRRASLCGRRDSTDPLDAPAGLIDAGACTRSYSTKRSAAPAFLFAVPSVRGRMTEHLSRRGRLSSSAMPVRPDHVRQDGGNCRL